MKKKTKMNSGERCVSGPGGTGELSCCGERNIQILYLK